MKYGVIVYHDTKNIGDDIQSYAAARLLPQVDYYIEREQLDTFRPDEEEQVSTIMNAWYMHNKLAWPPSAYINPLYVSMHFWAHDALEIEDLFLQGIGGESFRQHEPIGCRDQETCKFLENAGFKTWLTGCLTLTLSLSQDKRPQDYVCLTNVSEDVIKYLEARYPDVEFKVLTQESDDLINPEDSWEQRFENVKALLLLYQNARAVITTRLHCAMPCLALKTPVLLLSQEDIAEQGRFDGLKQLCHHDSVRNLLAGNCAFDLLAPPENPKTYLKYRKKLLRIVKKFLQESQSAPPENDQRYQEFEKNWLTRARWKNDCLQQVSTLAKKRWNINHDYIVSLQTNLDISTKRNEELQEWSEKQSAQIESLQGSLVEMEEGKAWLEEQTSALTQRNTELQEWSEKQSAQIESLQGSLAEVEAGKAWLEEQTSALTQRNTELQEWSEKQSAQIESLQGSLAEVESGKAWLEEQTSALTQRNTELQEWSEKQSAQIESLQGSLAEVEAGKAWLEEQTSALTQRNTELQEWSEKQSAQIESLQGSLAEVEAGKAWLEEQTSALTQRNTELQEWSEKQSAQIESLQGSLAEVESGKAWLEEQTSALTQRNTELQEWSEKQSAQIESLQGSLAEVESGKAWLEEQTSALTQRNTELQEWSEKQSAQIESLQGSLAEVEAGKAWLEEQNKQMQTKMHVYERLVGVITQQKDALESSVSRTRDK